jgi:aryl-alcohol dehydrogenase-like predicted oxidoreductase
VTAPVGFNAASFMTGCGSFDVNEAVAVVTELLSRAVALIDATGVTGSREAETLIGRTLRGRRDRAVLASGSGGRPADIVRECDATLRHLGTDRIDLYYLDRTDAEPPIEESVGALAALIDAGKVRQIGLSNVDGDRLRRAYAVHPVAMVSAEYSLLARHIEVDVLPSARALGVGVAAYRPLGSGLLTGSLVSLDQVAAGDYRRADPRFRPDNFSRNRRAVRLFERLATQRQVSVARLAIAWLLAQGEDIVPLPGTRNLTHLEMNLAAAEVRLTADDHAQLALLRLEENRDTSAARPVPDGTG